MSGLLLCARPYEGQPKSGFVEGQCNLCGHVVIYAPQNLEHVKAMHGDDYIVACSECTEVIFKEEPETIEAVKGMVGGKIYDDLAQFEDCAKAERLKRGGTR